MVDDDDDDDDDGGGGGGGGGGVVVWLIFLIVTNGCARGPITPLLAIVTIRDLFNTPPLTTTSRP